MDKKLAKENIGLAKHISKDLNEGRFSHALSTSEKMHKNLDKIRTEITSGKAKRER